MFYMTSGQGLQGKGVAKRKENIRTPKHEVQSLRKDNVRCSSLTS